MSVFVEIDSLEIKTRSGVSPKTGKPYNMREQSAYLHQPSKKYPTAFKITLEDNQHPYAVGKYELDDSSFFIGKYDDLQVRPVLKYTTTSVPAPVSNPTSAPPVSAPGGLASAAAAAASALK